MHFCTPPYIIGMYTHCAANKLVWASIDVTYAGDSTVGGTPVSHQRLMKKQKLGLQSCRTGVNPSFRVCVYFWAILIALPNFKLQYKLYIRNDICQIHTDKSPFNSLVWGLLRLTLIISFCSIYKTCPNAKCCDTKKMLHTQLQLYCTRMAYTV